MATLVTGASAGLGTAFARALADKGEDLILTARRRERLDTLATELRATGVQVDVFTADLADPSAPATLFREIAAAGLTIDTLINNAGYGGNGAFADMPIAPQLGQIDVNCRALVALSHGVLPGMIAAKRGSILNVASTAAFQAGPWLAVYAATKAFVLSFSEALHEEAKEHGIRVTALCPGPVHTEFADVAGMENTPLFDRFAAEPDQVVRDGLAALANGEAIRISGLANTLAAFGERFLPRSWTRGVAGLISRSR